MEEKKDIIVVARKGYSVLLNIGPNMLQIDCYNPINLSEQFPNTDLSKEQGLVANLRDGNLVYYTGQALPKDPLDRQINPLKPSVEENLETHYKQEGTPGLQDIGLETETDMTQDFADTIHKKAAEGRRAILDTDQKMLKDRTTSKQEAPQVRETSDGIIAPVVKQEPLDAKSLQMKVSMDVAPDEFVRKQKEAHDRRVAEERADEANASAEIQRLEQEDQQDQQESQN